MAKELHTQWKAWASPAEQKDFQALIGGLELALPKLNSRTSDFIKI